MNEASTPTKLEIPLFPLHSVLFPGGVLPLRIFEPRYLDMVSDCMKKETNFGICLIKEGSETGQPAMSFELGTIASIDYWHMRTDGILGITAHGESRFKIISTENQNNKLTMAQIETIPNETKIELPEEYSRMADMLEHIIKQLGYPFMRLKADYNDASWVSSRLTELLPIKLEQKQSCLEMNDPIKRMQQLSMLLKDI